MSFPRNGSLNNVLEYIRTPGEDRREWTPLTCNVGPGAAPLDPTQVLVWLAPAQI
jgi:hypothetical protein